MVKVQRDATGYHYDDKPGDGKVHNNKLLHDLHYPSGIEFPYPFHDTGIKVSATVINPNPWNEDDKSDEPFDLEGNLLIRPNPFGGFQCAIGKTGVRPETVKALEDTVKPVKAETKQFVKKDEEESTP